MSTRETEMAIRVGVLGYRLVKDAVDGFGISWNYKVSANEAGMNVYFADLNAVAEWLAS